MKTPPAWARLIPALAALSLLASSCSQGFDPWGEESTLVLQWSVDGAPAGEATCAAAGGDRVRMSIHADPVEWFDDRLEWPCADGGAYLDSTFHEGFFHVRFDLLDAEGEVVTSTRFRSVELVEGVNEVGDVDFELD